MMTAAGSRSQQWIIAAGSTDSLVYPPNHADSAVDAISSPIDSDAAALGLGAFRMGII